jgi:hypothetical protein
MSGYCHHQRQFSNPCGCNHYWSNSSRLGVTCFDDDNTCNDSCHSRQSIILHKTNTRRWFHSPCHRDLHLFPSSFWFLFYFLRTCLHSLPSTNLLGTFNVYISLEAMSVNSPKTCASHHNSSMGCTISHSSSSLPHILASALSSWVDLWQRMPF